MTATNDKLISKTLATRMLSCVKEYEAIKAKTSTKFKTVKEFCAANGFSPQNFMKIYRRYKMFPELNSLLPQKRGPKYKTRRTDIKIEERVIEYRKLGNNRYAIVQMLAAKDNVRICPTTVYNICKRYGLNSLTEKERLEHKRIITEQAGELAHIDLHELSTGLLDSDPRQKLYLLGLIDDHTRCVCIEVIKDKKASTVMFATMHALGMLYLQYGIQFKSLMSDNGSEFGAGIRTKNKDTHPFEVMLTELGINHVYTKAYRPQTNGKIERFWKTLDSELIDGMLFKDIQNLKDELYGYSIYYNEYRPHSSLNGLTPAKQNDKSKNI